MPVIICDRGGSESASKLCEATRLALGYLFKIHHRNGSPGSLRTELTLSTARTLATHRVMNAHVLQSQVCLC